MASSSEKALENWSPATTPRRIFSLRIVNLDYYMAPPVPGMDVCYSEFQGRGVREVPVVRIFGSTTSGQKTCLHLHKAFPYFYVPYDNELPQEVNDALAFVRRLASSIEKALKMASTVGAKRQHLHSCSLVRGKKFYGYHPSEQLFIKIVLYYPQEVSRVSTLLLSGGVMNHKFQPHEAHFSYLLQILDLERKRETESTILYKSSKYRRRTLILGKKARRKDTYATLIDHNLCGMGHLHLSSLKFRNPLPEAPSDLTSLIKRVKRDFTYQEAVPQVEAAAVDPSKDYNLLTESLLKEKAISTLPLSPQLMKGAVSEYTLSTLPPSRSSSPAFHQITTKDETLSTVPTSRFSPTTPFLKVKEEVVDTLPFLCPSSPAHHHTTMKPETSEPFPPSMSSSPALHLTTIKEETLSTLPPSKSAASDGNQTTIKEGTLITLPAPNSSSAAVYQTAPDGGSQSEMWLQNSVPGDWVWPLLASDNMETKVQAQGLYCKQSTCELEADASVEDILNRGELLFLPLQEAGPEIKMVQSLTPMWEEERARSGEGGPAGSIDPLYQPTPRTVPIPSPFEEAMRETLFKIARAEEQEIGTKNCSQTSTQSDSGLRTEPVLEICTLLGSQHELKISLRSADNSAAASDEDETDERRQSSVPSEIEPKSQPDSVFEPTHAGHGMATAINEQIIRKKLSQRCLSQDLDKEVADFLRWMGTTQLDTDDQEDGDSDSKDGEMAQMALSQLFSSPGMDAALLKALADYENATEQECRAILDCADLMDEEEQDAVDQNDVDAYSRRQTQVEGDEREESYRAPRDSHGSHEPRMEIDRKQAPPFIPQTDGAGDEGEPEPERDRTLQSFLSKRPRYDRKSPFASATSKYSDSRSGIQELSKEQKREVSLRDMMRRRRERKAGKKELVSPSAPILEGLPLEVKADFPKDIGGIISSPEGKHQRTRVRSAPQDQTTGVVYAGDSPQGEDLLAATSKGISQERHLASRRKGKVIHKLDNVNNFVTKFVTLPIVTLKYDSADVNCRTDGLSEKYSEGSEVGPLGFREDREDTESRNREDLALEGSSQKVLGEKIVHMDVTPRKEMAAVQSRGDDRDCGGGQTSFCLDQEFLQEPGPDTVFDMYTNNPPKVPGEQLVELPKKEPDGHPDYKRGLDSSDEDEFFVAQTQFPSIPTPLSGQSSQLQSEGLHPDVEGHESVDISSQGCEALLMSQVRKIANPPLTSENLIEHHGGKEESLVLDGAYQDSDIVRQTQVVKPDVSCMIELRPLEFEQSRERVRVDIQDEDVPLEQTHILRPHIPFWNSRDSKHSLDHNAEFEGLGITDEDEESAVQTQILELDNPHFGDIPQTMLVDRVTDLKESDGAEVEDEMLGLTQVLSHEGHQMIGSHSWKQVASVEEVRECDMADDDADFLRPTDILEVRSLRHPEIRCTESPMCVEGMRGQDGLDDTGELYEQTQKFELEMPYADQILTVKNLEYVEEVRGEDSSEEPHDSGAQTQIIAEEDLPSAANGGTTLEVSASPEVGDMSNVQIPAVVEAEMISGPSSRLAVETTEIPQEVQSSPLLHGERVPGFGDPSSSAYFTGTLGGSSHQGNYPTQYLFCDTSDDSEASYDSDQDRWCIGEKVSTAALFGDPEIGERGSRSSGDDHVEEGSVVLDRKGGLGDADENLQEVNTTPTFQERKKFKVDEDIGRPSTADNHGEQRGGRLGKDRWWDDPDEGEAVSAPITGAGEKDEDVDQRGGLSAAGEDTEMGSPKVRGVQPTQYLFTDMSDDSEASYDSGTGSRDSPRYAEEEFFADEEKEVERLRVAQEEQPSGLRAEKKLALTVANDEHRGMFQEHDNRNKAVVQQPLLMDVPGGKEARISDVPKTKEFDRKNDREFPCCTFSSFSVSNPLEDESLKNSEIITGRNLLPLPASSSECPRPYSGDDSRMKFGRKDVSKACIELSAVSCLESKESEDSKVMTKDNGLLDLSGTHSQANEEIGKECVIQDAEDIQLQAQSHTTCVASQEPSDFWKSALVPFVKDRNDEQLSPLIFHERPPTREQISQSFKEIVCNYKEDGVFYGNVKDVIDHPVVRAGLIFDVRSREAIHLRRFQFGRSNRRSNFDSGSKHRAYIQQESWGCEERSDLVPGIPTYIENDGTMLYIMTPARAPPSPRAVMQWLSLQSVQQIGTSRRVPGGGQQILTMDPNTGKLVPVVEIGSVANTQDSVPTTDSSQEDGDFVRPASPKYDEKHVFYLSHSSSAISSSHGFSHGGSVQKHPGDNSVKTFFSSRPVEEVERSSHGSAALVPYSAQASSQLEKSLVNTRDGKEEPEKKSSSGLPVDEGVKALLNRKLDEKLTTKVGKQWRDVSQMTAFTAATTPLSQSGFRDPASSGHGQQITLMSIEVFAETRGELLPDPRYDAVGCIVLVIHEDGGRSGNKDTTVVLIRDQEAYSTRRYPDGIQGCELIYLPDEKGLFKCFAQLVRVCDPDMLVGWEVQGFSLGLLAERAANLGISLLKQLSRVPPVSAVPSELFDKEVGGEPEAALFDRVPLETIGVDEPVIDDEWGRTHGSGLYIGGRTVLNAWRIMRGELKLNIYSIEAVAEAVLRRRVPRLPWQTLTRCFLRGPSGGRYCCIDYFIGRAKLTLEIMEQLDLINRTAELARVFGIDFYSVFSRGSQFRVESMMARLAHTQNYLLVSPTRQQVAEQPGMECLPLVMEPESRFYNSPVIVLDFQSLYPSMIIAYNLCFSTCLGKLSGENPKVLGVTKLKLGPGILSGLKESVTITPNGIMFAPKEVLPGVLPRLLQEILSTRIMVKKAMKALTPEQRVLQRVLNARQFALKLIANVTYGYTAAGFSGRMPCAEIADSIVQCGRLTLERAINMVNSNPRWNARVVYGDTDSMFVLCEGRSKDEAFQIGKEIAAAVTETNPPPVTLKLEKVYLPCVLLTKKRYVGYSFESPSQVKPIFDAKGIETIRRDTCPAVAKAVEHSLRILFDTQDLSQVKQYLQRQWGKILSGRVSIQDFVFAKEVRLGTYSARSPVLPPAAIVASKAMAVDPRAEPRYAERIPYVVVHGEPGARLVDMVVDPLTLISQPSLRLHDTYYITKQIIPACQRIFMLVGVDLRAWFSEMPRVYRPPISKRLSSLTMGAKSTKWDPDAGKFKRGQSLRHGTIDQYFLSRHCTICGEFTRASQRLCNKCLSSPRAVAILLPGRTARLEREYKHLQAICRHCGGGDASSPGDIACISLDCSIFYERRKVHRELIAAGAVSSDLGYYPPCLPELF